MLSKNRIAKAIAFALMALMMCFAMTGCGTDDIDISPYADETLTITGVQDEDIVLTIADLKAMDCETIKTHSTSDKIGDVKVTGPTLETVLAQYGASLADYHSAHFYGRDNYDIVLYDDYLAEHDLYLTFGESGEPWDEESAPLRVIIPESDSAYWIRMLEKIEFE
ncbi:MAG: molybdopterin-dependent oxidoreductase [Firmicutes bacterium]|nr:molybdopterin-dependent oxidoreductase [Bacillota bacterium]